MPIERVDQNSDVVSIQHDLLKPQEYLVTHHTLGLQPTIKARNSINSQILSVHRPATPKQQQQPLGDLTSHTHWTDR